MTVVSISRSGLTSAVIETVIFAKVDVTVIAGPPSTKLAARCDIVGDSVTSVKVRIYRCLGVRLILIGHVFGGCQQVEEEYLVEQRILTVWWTVLTPWTPVDAYTPFVHMLHLMLVSSLVCGVEAHNICSAMVRGRRVSWVADWIVRARLKHADGAICRHCPCRLEGWQRFCLCGLLCGRRLGPLVRPRYEGIVGEGHVSNVIFFAAKCPNTSIVMTA
jgi:hypothetical protein